MNEQVAKAFDIANLMATMANQKRILKEEFEQTLFYFHNGGTFQATPALISYIQSLKLLDLEENVVVVDNNGLPILVQSLSNFLEQLLDCHVRANNLYFTKYEALKKSRSVESILA
jgi:hypothetical protein